MLVEQEIEEEGDADEHVEEVTAGDNDHGDDSAAHGEVPTRVKKLEKRNKVRVLKLRRLQRVGTSQRFYTSDDIVLDDESNQGRMIAKMDEDDVVVLKVDKEEDKEVADKDVKKAKVDESAQVQGRQAESQAKIYKIYMNHASKVLSMQEDETEPAEVQEVVDVVTTTKLIIEVVTAASETITIASLDYFKGMSYDDIRPIFENKFNSNVDFLLKIKEQMEEEENIAQQKINETPAERASMRRKLDEEVEDLKRPICTCLNLEESKNCTWSSKCQELEAIGIMWCAYHNLYNHATDFVDGKEEYNARVHIKSKLHYFLLLKDRLGLDRCVLFRETCFGRWFDITYFENEESHIHYMLQKQKISDNDHYDILLIYSVKGHTLHFGRLEFCLISGFKFGFLSFHKFTEGEITFRDRVFPKKIGEYLKNIDLLSLIEDEYRFSSLFDPDSIRKSLEDVPGLSISHSKIGRIMGDFFPCIRVIKMVNFFSFNVSPNQSANKDHVNELVDALDDLVDENGVVEVEKDLSEDEDLKVQKLEAKNKRLAEQRRIRFHKMKEQENDIKSSYFSNSTHMKPALEKFRTNKRKFAKVLRPPVEEDTYVKVFRIDKIKKKNNVLDQYMIEKCQQLKPWGEEDALIGLDDKHLGWLLDDVFIPINEPKRHRSLAQFHIQSRNVTFYDNQKIKGVEYRLWYLKMRSCLKTKLLVLLHRTGVISSKGINPNSYSIKFCQEHNVPQQGGLFGDCGVFVCLFFIG
uniref:Phospholipase-like, aminotransferase-like mobile domain protein n=1 Tax=Tanacetum cinerariifolium TaxID=118510 RepID=A0A6L2JK77_TANCI|nr:phospholipase-like, aminotransferase-like mobile domain protein [Tanacetum cinerariifolium]